MAPRSGLRRALRDNVEGYLFISPWLIGFLAFTLGPMVAAFGLSFTVWDLVGSNAPDFVGVRNYTEALSNATVQKSLWVTGYYVLGTVPMKVGLGLLLALMLAPGLPGSNLFRAIFYVPSITTGVVLALLWSWMFEPQFGLINTMVRSVGLPGPPWLRNPSWAMPALILMGSVYVGRYMVVFLAGIKGIPRELYEVAQLDGANAWEQFWHVTLPMLSPSIFFNVVMAVIFSFQVFTEAYVMTNGGPVNATLVYVFLIWQQAFSFLHMGYASALAYILFAIILIFTVFQFRFSGWVYYEGASK